MVQERRVKAGSRHEVNLSVEIDVALVVNISIDVTGGYEETVDSDQTLSVINTASSPAPPALAPAVLAPPALTIVVPGPTTDPNNPYDEEGKWSRIPSIHTHRPSYMVGQSAACEVADMKEKRRSNNMQRYEGEQEDCGTMQGEPQLWLTCNMNWAMLLVQLKYTAAQGNRSFHINYILLFIQIVKLLILIICNNLDLDLDVFPRILRSCLVDLHMFVFYVALIIIT
ncbi:hypothetical protein V2J09_007066 [Rumex salicifolius]